MAGRIFYVFSCAAERMMVCKRAKVIDAFLLFCGCFLDVYFSWPEARIEFSLAHRSSEWFSRLAIRATNRRQA